MEYAQQFAAAALVLGGLGAVLWFARRRGWASFGAVQGRQRRLESVERLALGPHHTLHLVRIGNEMLLVACSQGGCALLERVPPQPAAAEVRQ